MSKKTKFICICDNKCISNIFIKKDELIDLYYFYECAETDYDYNLYFIINGKNYKEKLVKYHDFTKYFKKFEEYEYRELIINKILEDENIS